MRSTFDSAPRIYLNLSIAPPHADRFSTIVRALSAAGVRELTIDWECVFPWTIDERMNGPGCFTEEAVAGIGAVAARCGVRLIPRLARGGLIRALDRVPAFAHLTELTRSPDVHREYAAAAVRMADRVFDDLCSIGGELPGVVLGGTGGTAETEERFRELVTEPVAARFAEQGVPVEQEPTEPPWWDGPIEVAVVAQMADFNIGSDALGPQILAVADAVARLDQTVSAAWITARRVGETVAWAARDPGVRHAVVRSGEASIEIASCRGDLDETRVLMRDRLRGAMEDAGIDDYLSRRCAPVEEALALLAARLRAIE